MSGISCHHNYSNRSNGKRQTFKGKMNNGSPILCLIVGNGLRIIALFLTSKTQDFYVTKSFFFFYPQGVMKLFVIAPISSNYLHNIRHIESHKNLRKTK